MELQKAVNNSAYKTSVVIGASKLKQVCWYFTNIIFFKNSLNVFSSLKIFLLKIFGAEIGEKIVIKPCVNIKYPWKLKIGNFSWIGEEVWIDNLSEVIIGNSVTLSQGSMLLTGNHDYTKSTFDLISQSIILEDGVWIGAKSIVCPGIVCKSHSILSVGSVASKDLEAYTINKGNPALPIKNRIINN